MSRLPTLLTMLAAEPTDAFLLFAIAKEHEKAGDDAQALAYYLQCAQHNPDYVGLYYHLGKLYERRNDIDTAVATYTQGIAVAQQAGDRHAASELGAARMEWEE